MTNKPIKGYRLLSAAEIELINDIKGVADIVGQVFNNLDDVADPRWLAIAKTDLQKGFMALVRSIAQPEGF